MTAALAGVASGGLAGLPLINLHDHLDGGLRPQTVIDLARECGYTALPTYDPDALAAWFVAAANSGSLEKFLQTFAHTVAVLQTPESLTRVAAEAVVDLARDDVAWAEIRMAPELCENANLDMDTALHAMTTGLRAGERTARAEGRDIEAGLIVCAMRQTDRANDVAALVRHHADNGVIGFDIAGPEAGWPPERLADAFALVRDAGVHITVHAGEADGVESIRQALAVGAQRLGHGVRIIEDITFTADGRAHLGPIASEVRERSIALEICPTSNVQTGAVASFAAHPLAILDELGFLVTVNPDNRLMCGVGVAHELHVAESLLVADRTEDASRHFAGSPQKFKSAVRGIADGAAARWTRNAITSAFAPEPTKRRLFDLVAAYEGEN